MKRNLLVFVMILSVGLITSCGDDDSDAPPRHEVGVWDLKNYATINVPSEYALRNEDRTYTLNEVNLGIEEYILNLKVDGTFDRTIGFSGILPQDDSGAWILDDDDLILDSDDFDDDEEFGIEKNEDNDLWLSIPVQFLLIRDVVLDTISQEYVDSLTNEEFEALFDPVNLDLVFLFEKEL